jgi:hypothetical protein
MLPPMYTALMYTVSCPQDQKERAMCPAKRWQIARKPSSPGLFWVGAFSSDGFSYHTGKKTIAESATLMIF